MRFFYHLLILFTVIAAAGCGKSDSFKVSGTIESAGSSVVELLYSADGAYVRLSTTASDGKFTLRGSTPSPTVGFLSVSGGSPLVQLTLSNGTDIKCTVNPEDPFKAVIKGNKVNEEYGKFLNANAGILASGNAERINEAVKAFVASHRNSMAATVAVLTLFRACDHEILADSLLGIIAPDARPKSLLANYNHVLSGQLSAEAREPVSSMTLIGNNDSLVRFSPYRHSLSVFAFTGDSKSCRDSILPRLRELRKDFTDRQLSVIEVNTSPDSVTWKHVTDKDSATWHQVWKPGVLSSPGFRRIAVARIPFFIVADSVGTQLHRGSSVSVTEKIVREHFTSK